MNSISWDKNFPFLKLAIKAFEKGLQFQVIMFVIPYKKEALSVSLKHCAFEEIV